MRRLTRVDKMFISLTLSGSFRSAESNPPLNECLRGVVDLTQHRMVENCWWLWWAAVQYALELVSIRRNWFTNAGYKIIPFVHSAALNTKILSQNELPRVRSNGSTMIQAFSFVMPTDTVCLTRCNTTMHAGTSDLPATHLQNVESDRVQDHVHELSDHQLLIRFRQQAAWSNSAWT